MDPAPKPYVQVVIDGVDTVVHDPEGLYDADRYDRYATFEQARDAALCCIEDVLDEGDYDGDDHKAGLEAMLRPLEAARCMEELEGQLDYRRLLERLVMSRPPPLDDVPEGYPSGPRRLLSRQVEVHGPMLSLQLEFCRTVA